MNEIQLDTKSLMGVRVCADAVDGDNERRVVAEKLATSEKLGLKAGTPTKFCP